MSTLSFPFNRVAAYGDRDYDQDSGFEMAEPNPLHFDLPQPADASVRGQFLELRRYTPAAIAVYKEVRGSYTKLFARRGQNADGLTHFAAVHTRHGWRVLDTPKTEPFWAVRSARAPGTADAQPSLYDAPRQLSLDYALRNNGATYISLLAGFLYGGGLAYGAFADAALFQLRPVTVQFILRRDFLFLQRWSEHNDDGEDTNDVATLEARQQTFVEHFRAMQVPVGDRNVAPSCAFEESTDVQLGLLRSITPARIALYESSAKRQAFVRTHERPGEPTERLLDVALARTPRGWLPLSQQHAFVDGFHGRAALPSVPYAKLFGSIRPAVYFTGLFDAWLYAGGVRFDIPETVPEANTYQHHYITPQADKHIERWRACAWASSAGHLEAWGQVFSFPLPFVAGFPSSASYASAATTDPARGLPPAVVKARECVIYQWAEVRPGPAGWTVDAPPTLQMSPDIFSEAERGVLVDVAKPSPKGSPRPLARRLTWPGLSSPVSMTSSPTGEAQPSSL